MLKLESTPCITRLHDVPTPGWHTAPPTLCSTDTSSRAPLPSPPHPTFSQQTPSASLLGAARPPAWQGEKRPDVLVRGRTATWRLRVTVSCSRLRLCRYTRCHCTLNIHLCVLQTQGSVLPAPPSNDKKLGKKWMGIKAH